MALEKKITITKRGREALESELRNLIDVVRPEVIEQLKAARAQGDLSDNADYDAARDKQAQVESRIKELEHMIRNAEIISEKKGAKNVRLGSTVTIEDLDTNERMTFTIVGTVEADPLNGKVSNATPLAEAILEQKAGDIVTIEVDEPYQVKIVEIK